MFYVDFNWEFLLEHNTVYTEREEEIKKRENLTQVSSVENWQKGNASKRYLERVILLI